MKDCFVDCKGIASMCENKSLKPIPTEMLSKSIWIVSMPIDSDTVKSVSISLFSVLTLQETRKKTQMVKKTVLIVVPKTTVILITIFFSPRLYHLFDIKRINFIFVRQPSRNYNVKNDKKRYNRYYYHIYQQVYYFLV